MRKFSKKIAMMMVLAMLVSLFSGIVSASAASIWSAKSVDDDNYAVVMGETIEVKKGEFINFDLFKADEEATKAGYTYTWESSDAEVLFIVAEGKNSGYARVKGEAGDKAVVSATFTNVASGKSATRSFNVVVVDELKAEEAEVEYAIVPAFGEETFAVGAEYELKAAVTADGKEVEAKVVFAVNGKAIEGKYAPAAGDTAIVITATVAGKEITKTVDIVVEEKAVASEIVAAKQVSDKKVELTFDEAITDAEAANIQLFLGDVAKDINKKKATADGNKVVYESYISFGNEKTWTFVYGDSKFDVKSSQGEVAKIVVTGPEVVYKNEGLTADIKYTCYDANGVEVAKPDSTYIEWKVDDTTAASAANDKITFFDFGKGVTLTGIYHTYKYDEANNYAEVTLDVAGFSVICLESNAATIAGVSKMGVDAEYKTMTVPAGKYDRKLYVQFAYTDGKTFATADEINTAAGKNVITYASTDEKTLIVDPYSGKLIPIKQGSAVVLIMNGEDIAAKATVIIGPAVAANDPAVDKASQVVSNSTALKRSVTFTFTGKDNYGGNVDWTAADVSVITTPYNPDKPDEKAKADNVPSYLALDANKLKVNAVNGETPLKSGTYVFEVKLTNTVTASKEVKIRVSVYVQDATTSKDVKSYKVELVGGVNNNFDTTITKDTKADVLDDVVAFKIFGLNKDGVAVSEITSGAKLNIKLNGKDFIKETDICTIPLYVTGTAINGALQSQKTGTYQITGKIGEVALPSLTFTISNSQATPKLNVVGATAELTAGAVSGDALKVELAKCFATPDDTTDNKYTDAVVTEAVSTVDNTSAKGTYGAFVKKVTFDELFIKSSIVVTHSVEVNTNVTVTLK